MATFEFNGKTIYIDGRLKKQLDKKILPSLLKEDKDVVFVVDGGEREGKSKFADLLGVYAASILKTAYDLSCFGMTPEEFRNKILTSEKRCVVIYDEAHRGMASARTLSEINNILKDLMMEMGQKNLFVIIVLPTFFLLDKYAALFRAKGLFHVYERKGKRGFWVYFNKRNKLKLYRGGKKEFDYNCIKWPRFRGRFLKQYAVDEQEYKKKKSKAFKEKPRITKGEVYKAQRDTALYIIHKEFNVNDIQIAKLCKKYRWDVKRRTICDIRLQKDKEIARKELEIEEDVTESEEKRHEN